MSEFGLKIKNIKAGTLFGYNQGIRDRYDFTDAMFSNSLFADFIRANGLEVWKEESTRDIICLDFDFGSRSYEEELEHLSKMLQKENLTQESIEKIEEIINQVHEQKDLYVKMSKEEIRTLFYENGVSVKYVTRNKNGEIKNENEIKYKMLYRSSAKAKVGQVIFINEKLYDIAYDWLTMGLGKKMPYDNAMIVEMSAYAPLTTSTIVDKMFIPVEDILILKDQDSIFTTLAKIVESDDYPVTVKVLDEEKTERNKQRAIERCDFLADGVTPKYKRAYKKVEEMRKKCIVNTREAEVKNTLWDGMALIESSYVPEYVNGMLLLRNHFFKSCAFRSNIQLFFQEWCKQNGKDYETYEIEDMFGRKHRMKDIKVITTDNSIKWKKFANLMGNTLSEAYDYWCERINADGSYWGIVKTDHESKLGEVQQMSYQMINTLPCTKEDIKELASTSVEYVTKLKNDADEFEKFLRKNANVVNHYEMLADLYVHNKDFANSTWFRYEKRNIIKAYVDKLRTGKITIEADNLTICGNPYALLLYSVGEDWTKDPTLCPEKDVIQCYTTRFADNEYLCGIRNPHNSPNNICYLHNRYSPEMEKYFPFSQNILAVNCIKTDIQDRANGCDFDSDFFFVTNNPVMVRCAKECYKNYPTIVNHLKESGITYKNNMAAYAQMDNKFAKSRLGIGQSSNLAMLAITYYWTEPNQELYDNFVILSVLAQVIIDGCKREYEVSVEEIDRIHNLDSMARIKKILDENDKERKILFDFPEFMKYTKRVKFTKNGKLRPYEDVKKEKDKLKSRIDKDLVCPMNWLQEVLDEIPRGSTATTTPTKDFFIKLTGDANRRQAKKIKDLIEEFELFRLSTQDSEKIIEAYSNLLEEVKKIKINNPVTINRLIENSLLMEKVKSKDQSTGVKYVQKTLNVLYRYDKNKFLKNFVEQKMHT